MHKTVATAVMSAMVLVSGLAACSTLTQAQGSGTGAQTAARPVATPAAAQHVEPVSALVHPATGKYLGIEAQGAPDSLDPVRTVAAELGQNPDLIGDYVGWNGAFDATAASNSASYGALYYVVWEPFGVTVRSIADGGSDAYITKFAQAVRNFGKPVAISFGHEMNGNWYPWGTTKTTPAEFVAAWRHIHDLFANAGATNVIWIWNPNVINPVPDVQLKPYWPGSTYVDWVGLTGYFATTGSHTFDGIYGDTITEVRRFSSKPFIVAETSVETGPSEIVSVRNLINGVEKSGDVLGLIWFDYDKNGVDWTLGGRPEIRATAAGLLAGLRLVNLGA